MTSYGSIFNSTIGGAVFLLSTFYGAVQTAYAYIHLQPSNYKNTALDSITIDDIESEKIGALFSKISNLRKLDNRIHLYFPKEKSELYYIDPAKWLLLAICFEGLFSEVYHKKYDLKNSYNRFVLFTINFPFCRKNRSF